ncbi:hypothetical protein ACW9UR_03205 [Halovulum sp. GXIMD14794]
MPDRTKIATCSYCGTRAVLDFSKGPRHELICTACGAHLSEMKPLRTDRSGKSSPPRKAPHPDPVPAKKPKKTKAKKRKSPFKRLGGHVEDIFDAIEDIFD